jgi:hypothetical protein
MAHGPLDLPFGSPFGSHLRYVYAGASLYGLLRQLVNSLGGNYEPAAYPNGREDIVSNCPVQRIGIASKDRRCFPDGVKRRSVGQPVHACHHNITPYSYVKPCHIVATSVSEAG